MREESLVGITAIIALVVTSTLLMGISVLEKNTLRETYETRIGELVQANENLKAENDALTCYIDTGYPICSKNMQSVAKRVSGISADNYIITEPNNNTMSQYEGVFE